MFEQMDKFHPDEPCYHLAFIAVDPAVYGKGYGTKMLKHTLALCDQDKKLACLESTNPANISIYKRHGFELIGSIEAEGAPSMFPMLRKPR
jgi:ribosomal protein S18 acetylase RimI-like enzyme